MTYEEIQKYPVGTIYKFKITKYNVNGFWYNDGDRIILATDDTLTNLHFYDDNTYTAIRTQRTDYKIDGWLFNGTEWHCVELTWDGYQEIDDEEILKF